MFSPTSSNGSESPNQLQNHDQNLNLNQEISINQNQEEEQEQQQQPIEEENELDSSFFPSPSHYYELYTSSNLLLPPNTLLPLLPGEIESRGTSNDLLPPNPDWIIETGSYAVFGETWPVEEVLPTLEELGVKELFDREADRSASLLLLLRALLLNYTSLITSLLSPPPSLVSRPVPSSTEPPILEGMQLPTDPERLVEHIRLISINMHHLVNELRPVQARETLKNMMRSQIEARKLKTLAIKQKIAEVKSNLLTVQSQIHQDNQNLVEFDNEMEDITSETISPEGKVDLDEKNKIKIDFERLKKVVESLS